jgi:hypothetical protein
MAALNYRLYPTDPSLSGRVKHIVKNLHKGTSSIDITHFRNLLRFKRVAPHLARLLAAGGIWVLNPEPFFERLVKCKIEHVCLHFYSFLNGDNFCRPWFMLSLHVRIRPTP